MQFSLLGLFSLSLLGSLHCVAMCGPLTALYGASGKASTSFAAAAETGQGEGGPPERSASAQRSERVIAHLAYHLPRGALYTLYGALAGGIGASLNWAGALFGVGRLALFCSLLVLLFLLIKTFFPSWAARVLPSRGTARLVQLSGGRLKAASPQRRAFLLGLLTPFLPCGYLYGFIALSAGTGSALSGALFMAVFWLGTLPSLLLVSHFAGQLSLRLRAKIPYLTALSLFLLGVFSLYQHSRVGNSLGARLEAAAQGGLGSLSKSGLQSQQADAEEAK